VTPGEETKEAGALALAAIKQASQDLKEGKIDAIVTAPINKNNIQSDSFQFPGHTEFLAHLAANRIGFEFEILISVQEVGVFKPDPAVYQHAAKRLGLEPAACLMVSANSFDVLGARLCGFRGAFVNRGQLPYEDSSYRPDLEVPDFNCLADGLGV